MSELITGVLAFATLTVIVWAAVGIARRVTR
jgi:hypothetical protein